MTGVVKCEIISRSPNFDFADCSTGSRFSAVPGIESRAMDDVEEMPSAGIFKAAAAFILFSIALVGGILPQRLKNVGSKVVSCLNTAAGGVFFASAMVR